jgi:hypothetical protein
MVAAKRIDKSLLLDVRDYNQRRLAVVVGTGFIQIAIPLQFGKGVNQLFGHHSINQWLIYFL